MNKKWMPYLLLCGLIVILFFILGFRYGQSVEKTNKKVELLISIPPTFTPAPTQHPLEFRLYSHNFCGVEFLRPTSLTVTREGSGGAMLSEKNTVMISFDCEKATTITPNKQKATEITFQKNNIKVFFHDDKYQFVLINNKNNKKITFSVQKRLLPLLDTSLQFFSK